MEKKYINVEGIEYYVVYEDDNYIYVQGDDIILKNKDSFVILEDSIMPKYVDNINKPLIYVKRRIKIESKETE